jgi:hypothetical protein
VSENTLVIGAPYEASNATGINGDQDDNTVLYAGAAYVFVRNGTNWSQQAYLKASNPGARDQFGWDVAVWGDMVVVGANAEDSNATGINGNQTDNSASAAGAAYVFTGLECSPQLAIAPDGRGGYVISFPGLPGSTYRLLHAPSVTGPWSTLATTNALASGLIEYYNPTPPSNQSFYRAVTP